MFHLIMTLLIYVVDAESVKCPESCTCVETRVFVNGPGSTLGDDSGNPITFDRDDFNGDGTTTTATATDGDPTTAITASGRNLNAYKILLNDFQVDVRSESNETLSSAYPNAWAGKKCSKTPGDNLRDIFLSNFSKTDSQTVHNSQGDHNHITNSNSRDLRIKRTLKVGTTTGEVAVTGLGGGPGENVQSVMVKTNEPISSGNEDKSTGFTGAGGGTAESTAGTTAETSNRPGIFTYQITCDGIRDLKSLWLQYFPNPATRLIIRRTYFQSFNLLRQILRESPVKLNQLTLLSISDGVINQTAADKKHSETDVAGSKMKNSNVQPFEGAAEEFLPFASLQNPRPRSKSEILDQFPGNREKYKTVKVLALVNNTITSLPGDTFRPFQNLEVLNLSDNLIEFIERDTFSHLVNLVELDLSNNRLVSLNEFLFKNLTKLLYLDVSQNAISNVAPSTFQYLSSLNVLNLARNPLSEKEEETVILLGAGKRLQIVDISKTGIKQIPGTLERSVRVLNLEGNHLLSVRCGDLDSYSLLSYLNLRDNKISYVEDDALGRLELLTNLQIGANNLFQIPKSLPNNLEVLNLSNNNIQNITSSDFLNLFLLKQLSLSYNQVSNIEENSMNNLHNLEVLDLSHNPILILPNIYGTSKLTNLNLSYLTNVPENSSVRYRQFPIQSPENIRRLNLASSPLLTTIFLQDTKTLEAFANLEELDVRFSNLTTMRNDILGLLPRLRRLKVEGNPWHCGREILMLSDWLRGHERGKTVVEEDEINTAHCSTPGHLYKTALVSLRETDFDEESVQNGGGSIVGGEKFSRSKQRVDDDDGGAAPAAAASLEIAKTSKIGKLETLVNPREKFGNVKKTFSDMRSNITAKEPKVEKVSLKKDSKTSVKSLSAIKAKANFHVERKSDGSSAEYGKAKDDSKGTISSVPTAFTTITPPNSRYLAGVTTPTAPTTSTTKGSNLGESHVEPNGSAVAAKTQMAANKAEAVTANDSLTSPDTKYNSHLSFFVLSSVGLVVMVTVALTSLYFSKSRRDQSYQRQTQDIEVCSISSIGNELW